jgi:hypothetical protein
MFCDLQKAFDSVHYDILLRKLEFYGIRFNSSSSEWGKIKHGVPQGFIQGPLLFLFYVNDLPEIIKCNSKPVLFTDDTSLIIANPCYLNFKTYTDNVCNQEVFQISFPQFV